MDKKCGCADSNFGHKSNINWLENKSNITANARAAVRTASRQPGYEACTVGIKSGKER